MAFGLFGPFWTFWGFLGFLAFFGLFDLKVFLTFFAVAGLFGPFYKILIRFNLRLTEGRFQRSLVGIAGPFVAVSTKVYQVALGLRLIFLTC